MSDTTDRLSDPRLPLSVDEDREFKAVKAAVYFLRVWRKKESVSAVLRVFQATEDSIRKADCCAYLRRLRALETLQCQGGNRTGTDSEPILSGTREPILSTAGTDSSQQAGTVTGTENRVSSLTVNINKNGGEEKPKGDDAADDLANSFRFRQNLRSVIDKIGQAK